MRPFLAALLLTLTLPAQSPLTDDLAITASRSFAGGRHVIRDAGFDGVLRVTGKDIVLDGGGLELRGAIKGETADRYGGFGLVIEDAKQVTIRNFKISGYRVGILARRCAKLVIEDCDVSENYRQRLRSTPEKEDPADWLRPHDNDRNEWLRYGAGIALTDCEEFIVRRCRGRRQQNGACLTRCWAGEVHDCDFSFNSGWGVALYRSRLNQIYDNKMDWCIRGYSHGVYNRGQDSAGILLFEQCTKNFILRNSATHCGDGFFLYAGEDTLRRDGKGGSNENRVNNNDFSHASNNGIEATFSCGNKFRENIVRDCHYGFWGGYSWGTYLRSNRFENCETAIAVEHGSLSTIEDNVIRDCGVGISLWADPKPAFEDTAFGKQHDCRSRDWKIRDNNLVEVDIALRLRHTQEIEFTGNRVRARHAAFEGDHVVGLVVQGNELSGPKSLGENVSATWDLNGGPDAPSGLTTGPPFVLKLSEEWPRPTANIKKGSKRITAHLPKGTPRGRYRIFVDAWGPYDFSAPRVWPQRILGGAQTKVHLLGNGQRFLLGKPAGAVIAAPLSGTLPQTVDLSARTDGIVPFRIPVEVAGHEDLAIDGWLVNLDWRVAFRRWDSAGAKQPPRDWPAVLRADPLVIQRVSSLDFRWPGAPYRTVPADWFATVAETTVKTPAGRFRLHLESDDGIRVFVDGAVVHEDWTWHPPRRATVDLQLEAGTHTIRVEHFEIDGYARLALSLEPLER